MKQADQTKRPQLESGIKESQRTIARMTALAAAILSLLIVPTYHLIELFNGTDRDLIWHHAPWRTLVLVVAIITLFQYRPGHTGRHLPILLRVLSLAITVMMFGLFTTAWLHPEGDPERMTRGLILTTFALTLLTLKGGRELLAIYAAPFALSILTLWQAGVDMRAVAMKLVDPLMMLIIAVFISELFHRIRRHSARLEGELARLAGLDTLTGLHNRRFLESRTAAELARAQRHDAPFSVVIGDLDHFKRINDHYGHNIGDQVLREVAKCIRDNLRQEDLAVRWGGEEFLLLLPGLDEAGALQVAEKVRRILAQATLQCDDHEISVTISLGVAEYAGEDSFINLVRRADEAMYRAKAEGRNRVCVANGHAGADAGQSPSE